MKRIVRACIDELLKFDSQSDADLFAMQLCHSGRKNRVDSVELQQDGTVLVRVKRQYNNAELFEKEE